MKFQKLDISVFSIVLLTACGSSGGGSGVTNNTPSNNTPSANTTTSPAFKLRNLDGTYNLSEAQVDASGRYIISSRMFRVSGNPINVDVTLPSITSNGITTIVQGANNLTESIGGAGYSYSRFGMLSQTNDIGNSEVFYVGKQTITMPTTGKITYMGNAVTSGVDWKSVAQSSNKFTVDFGAKTINGTVGSFGQQSSSAFSNVIVGDTTLTGKINGSTFSGTTSTPLASKAQPTLSGSFSGAFFGPNAEELGGTGNQYAGGRTFSFGAKKQ